MKKFFYIITIFCFVSACGSDALTLKKKSSTDEFLVEKKSPLVLPPDFNELPLPKTSENIEKRGNSIGMAFRLSTELVSGILVGSVMGWSIDKWLGSQPWFFLIFFILGIAAGIINVIKTAKNMNNES